MPYLCSFFKKARGAPMWSPAGVLCKLNREDMETLPYNVVLQFYFRGFRCTKKSIPKKRNGFCMCFINYSAMSVTTPEPTVLPPSRIANLRPFSIAIGVISSTFIFTLSPGIHISTPSGSEITPVTSVVLK